MKILSENNGRFILRFERGEEVIEELRTFAEAKKITAAFFYGLGGASLVTLSDYSLADRAYHDLTLRGSLEVASLIGNIARDEGNEPVVHAHATIGKEDMSTAAGHVKELAVGGTCELLMQEAAGTLHRAFDKNTGLQLLQ